MKRPGRQHLPDGEALRGLYESVMRALAKVVTDRRWAAPLSAMALGFGLFLGVAIGPGTAGSLATGAAQIVAIPALASEEEAGDESAGGGGAGFAVEPAAEPLEEEAEAFEPEPLAGEFVSEPEPEEGTEPEGKGAPPPSEPEAEEEETESVEVKGTVVRANPAASSYTLAVPGGELVSVHAPKLPAARTKLAIEAVPLPNNTFAEQGRKPSGRAAAASFSGVVTYVDADPVAPAYTVSGRGSSILVHADPAQAASLPVLGAYAKVSVGLEPAPSAPPAPEAVPAVPAPCAADPALAPSSPPPTIAVQRSLELEAEPATYVDLAGVVSALCPQTGQLLISADDLRESGADVLLTVPAKFKIAKLKVGDSVLATATLGEGGALTLAGLASDEGKKGAADASAAQGDLAR